MKNEYKNETFEYSAGVKLIRYYTWILLGTGPFFDGLLAYIVNQKEKEKIFPREYFIIFELFSMLLLIVGFVFPRYFPIRYPFTMDYWRSFCQLAIINTSSTI